VTVTPARHGCESFYDCLSGDGRPGGGDFAPAWTLPLSASSSPTTPVDHPPIGRRRGLLIEVVFESRAGTARCGGGRVEQSSRAPRDIGCTASVAEFPEIRETGRGGFAMDRVSDGRSRRADQVREPGLQRDDAGTARTAGSGQGGVVMMTALPAERGSLNDDDLTLLRLLAQGLPLDTVARRLHTSERTIRRRSRAICDRLGVPAPITAVLWAARRGLL
jgi:DNA-binding CsgD family transcriptional regulator